MPIVEAHVVDICGYEIVLVETLWIQYYQCKSHHSNVNAYIPHLTATTNQRSTVEASAEIEKY